MTLYLETSVTDQLQLLMLFNVHVFYLSYFCFIHFYFSLFILYNYFDM